MDGHAVCDYPVPSLSVSSQEIILCEAFVLPLNSSGKEHNAS